jgi:hypothetical protein
MSMMTPLEQLRSILDENYISEDGDAYKIELSPGLTEAAIDALAARLPTGQIPPDIRELLRFSSGFHMHGLEEVRFDGNGFGFEEFFPYTIELAGDGAGNFWILDVGEDGSWNSVFFVCHDPAVVVKQSNGLAEFIKHVDEFGKKGRNSSLDVIQERTIFEIWEGDGGFIAIEDARSSIDRTLSDFASGLSDQFVIADLRDKPNGAGFAWGKFGPEIDQAVRHSPGLIWGVEAGKRAAERMKGGKAANRGKETSTEKHVKEPGQRRKGFFSRLFGR